jgi:hypothetical protein
MNRPINLKEYQNDKVKRGQRFKLYDSRLDPDFCGNYVLCEVGNEKYQLISMERWNRFKDGYIDNTKEDILKLLDKEQNLYLD